MINFLKNFGKGILYILVLPFLLVALAIYAVVALFVFVFIAIKGLILFFTGRSLYDDFPEDIEAKKRLGIIPQDKEHTDINIGNPTITGAPNYGTEQPRTADPFYVPEYLKQAEVENEDDIPAFEEEPEVTFTPNQQMEQPNIEPEPMSEPEPEPEMESEPEIKQEIESMYQPEPEVEVKKESVFEDDENEISIEKTVQNTAILDISEIEDEEEESTDSGIDIDFN